MAANAAPGAVDQLANDLNNTSLNGGDAKAPAVDTGGRGADGAGPNVLQQQLAAAPPAQQKQILGELIFPKIQAINGELAGKITGMLLEMDNAELVNLIEDDAALKAKVDEALAVYDEYVKAQGSEGGEPKKEEETKA
ncbi:Uncharacterized protein Y057_14258 [Fusarium fujikuroi]|nr:Uncharacterized protein Y057_14258 [Fusarium fujikuroi]